MRNKAFLLNHIITKDRILDKYSLFLNFYDVRAQTTVPNESKSPTNNVNLHKVILPFLKKQFDCQTSSPL